MGIETEEYDPENDLVEVVNISSEIMKFELERIKYKLKPKEVVKIPKAYAMVKVMAEGRDPVPPTIELLTNKKVLPVTDKRAKAVMGTATRS
jgi:hypothetical protein